MSSELDDLIKELKREIFEEEVEDPLFLFAETRKKIKEKKRNEKRKEDRKLKKAERISKAMVTIRPKYDYLVDEIVKESGKSRMEVFKDIQSKEYIFLKNAQPNRYITFEESLEKLYEMFLIVYLDLVKKGK